MFCYGVMAPENTQKGRWPFLGHYAGIDIDKIPKSGDRQTVPGLKSLLLTNHCDAIFREFQLQDVFFHLSQAIWRKVCDLGLISDYIQNEEVRMFTKILAALAFLDTRTVSAVFKTLDEMRVDQNQDLLTLRRHLHWATWAGWGKKT